MEALLGFDASIGPLTTSIMPETNGTILVPSHDFTEYGLWNITGSERVTTIEGFAEFANSTDYIFSNNSKNETGRRPNSVSPFYPVIVAAMVISVLCLIVSIMAYATLPEFRNVHGKNLLSLSSCLLTTFSLLILDISLRNHVSKGFCFVMAAIVHVTFLATFFWTNVMAFDIYRSIASMRARSEVKSQSRKYLKYSLYAWTATLLTALPAALFEGTDLVPYKYRPRFGERRCWLSGTTAFVFYFNFPVGVILFGNLILFLLTIRKLWIIKKMTAILNVKQQQKRLNLYLKLFLVMGITWVTEFLPWVTGIFSLYALAGMLTGLHGVLLFAIFVAKKKILLQLWERVKNCKSGVATKKTSFASQPTLSTYNSTSTSRT